MKRRWVKRLIVCVVVGVGAAWGSAWVIAAYAQMRRVQRVYPLQLPVQGELSRLPIAVWAPPLPREWPTPEVVGEYAEWGERTTGAFGMNADYQVFTAAYRYGWPVPALQRLTLRTYPDSESSPTLSAMQRGIGPPKFAQPLEDVDSFPLQPVWPGFAVNAAFYGAVCFLLMATPGVVRRWRRRRRGACASCGYALEGLGTCPECGSDA